MGMFPSGENCVNGGIATEQVVPPRKLLRVMLKKMKEKLTVVLH